MDSIKNILRDNTTNKSIKCVFCNKDRVLLTRICNRDIYENCSCEEFAEQQRIEQKRNEEEDYLKIKQQIEEETKASKEARRKELIKNSNRPKRHETRTFKKFNVNHANKLAFDICYNFAVNQLTHNIFLYGSFGVGKTHLAISILNYLLKNNREVVFKPSGELFDDIISSFESRNTQQIINLYSNIKTLIIDDLGKEKPTEFTISTLYKIINARYENQLPTIITSNYTINQLIDKFKINGDEITAVAIFRRICEDCKVIEIEKTQEQKLTSKDNDIFNFNNC